MAESLLSMSSFKAFVTKEFKQIYRDKRTLVVLFGMPVIMILLFGFAIRNEVENAKVVVLDASQDQVTRELINKIEASNYFTVAGRIQWYNKIDALFRQGNIDEVIVF